LVPGVNCSADGITNCSVAAFNKTEQYDELVTKVFDNTQNWFNVTDKTWSLPVTNLLYGTESYFLSSETSSAKFDYRSDLILLPKTTYTKFTTAIGKVVKAVKCGTTGCIYTGVCSEIESVLSNFTIRFGNELNFVLPVRTEAMDDASSVVCNV